MKRLFTVLLLTIAFTYCKAQGYIVTTIAGTGAEGYNGDSIQAITAELGGSYHLTTDSAHNLYIGDYSNHCIRKISPNGIITTIAGIPGNGGYSGDSGLATSAQLYYPEGVAFDKAGNFYIGDDGNMVIRKIDKNGIITTFAGNGVGAYGGDGGPAIDAELNHPSNIVADDTGNIYIADCYNNLIRKVDTSGIITTFAGTGVQGYSGDNGPATSAAIYYPYSMTFDKSGDLVFGDYGNNRIRKITPAGIITTIAGTGVQGYTGENVPALEAELFYPADIIYDSLGDLIFTDQFNDVIRKIDTQGIITTIAGNNVQGFNGDSLGSTLTELFFPMGLAFDSTGNLLFSDRQNYRIRKLTPFSLPVKLLQFTASLVKNNVVCKWQTASEVNSSHFNVQRSLDGINFSTIGKVSAVGNSTVKSSYSFSDVNISLLNTDKLYYRLQPVDKDGSISYSNTDLIKLSSNTIVVSWPNPVNDQLNVQVNNYSGQITLSVIDMAGHTLQTIDKSVNAGDNVIINTNSLAAGVYFLSANVNGCFIQRKFVKE